MNKDDEHFFCERGFNKPTKTQHHQTKRDIEIMHEREIEEEEYWSRLIVLSSQYEIIHLKKLSPSLRDKKNCQRPCWNN